MYIMALVALDPGDYDEWERRHGAEGWGFRDVLPMFRRSEKFRGFGVDEK